MKNIVDAKLSRIKRGSADETAQFRQAVYINWAKKKLIPDPCDEHPGYQRIVSCFVENLMLDNNSCSKTVKGYTESINTLFRLRGFPVPVDLSDKNNMCTQLIDALENEEVIAKQRDPITNEMFANMKKLARESSSDSAISTIFDYFCLIRITGFRIAEYGKTMQTKVDMHEYPSGNLVVKAFLPIDWVFKNEKGHLIKIHSLDVNTVAPSKVKITFRIQKNR